MQLRRLEAAESDVRTLDARIAERLKPYEAYMSLLSKRGDSGTWRRGALL